MKINQAIFNAPFYGGNLSLDFLNTVYDRRHGSGEGYLHNYLDLVTWAHVAEAIRDSQKEELLQMGRNEKRKANRICKDTLQLREAMYQFVADTINEDRVSPVHLQLINRWLSKVFSNLHLTKVENRFVLDWKQENFGLESVLWPILRSFTDLVTSEDRHRIKQCSNCGWLFVDNSKNKSRRWCSMDVCGNRVKARRYARKTRS